MRRPDWVERLSLYIEVNARREFAYGEWDCCLFAAGAVAAMTDVDPAAGIRGRYANREQGLAFAPEGLPAFLDAAGLKEVPLLRAQRGDVVYRSSEDEGLLGIVALNGREVYVLGEGGLQTTPIRFFERAWRV